MEITQARYLISAERVDQCPTHSEPEICFIGRSNVGKSSLINAFTGHPKLAKTSGTPGKTRLLNYFTINHGDWFLVDLPGYGYAKVSQEKRAEWTRTMNKFLLEREQLALIIMLADARHDPLESDMDMAYWLAEHQRPFILALTKSDKLSKNQQKKVVSLFEKELESMNIETEIVLTSASTREGIDELRDIVGSFVGGYSQTESSQQ